MLARSPSRALALVAAVSMVAVVLVGVPTTGTPASAQGAVDFGVADAGALDVWNEAPLTFVGDAPDDQTLTVLLGLVGDRGALEARARAVSDPRSPAYGSQGTVAAEAAAHNADDATIARVTGWFAARGVAATTDPTRTYVTATLPVAVAEEAFGVAYGRYDADDGNLAPAVVDAPMAPPTLAPGLAGSIDRVYGAVRAVPVPETPEPAGVSTTPAGIPTADPPAVAGPIAGSQPSSSTPAAVVDGGIETRSGTWEGCAEAADALVLDGRAYGLSPGQLRTAYGIDDLWAAGHRGRGARVAVVDMLDGTVSPSDLDGYRSCFGLTGPQIVPHVVGEHTTEVDDESTLDLQVMSAVVPEADRLDWFAYPAADEATELSRAMIEMMVSALDAGATGGEAPDVVSVSFGYCEPFLELADPAYRVGADILDQALATGAAAGVGYVVASGDNGSSGCYRFTGETDVAASWPAVSPWVTAVGGTNLALADDNTIADTGVWNDTAFGIAEDLTGGGGGGVSTTRPRPWWQQGAGVPTGAGRLVPDVAAFADPLPGYAILLDGTWTPIGGTSASTPLTAGALALLQSIADGGGQPRIGFAAPLLYELARTDAAPGGPFLDVTVGTNDVYGVGVYPALDGFDLATGWGSLLHDRLALALRPPSAPAGVPALAAVGTGRPLTYRLVADPVVHGGTAVSFAWDVDGDGTVDAVTDRPELTHTYPSAGARTATVVVRTSLGRHATFSATVWADATGGRADQTPAVTPVFTG